MEHVAQAPRARSFATTQALDELADLIAELHTVELALGSLDADESEASAVRTTVLRIMGRIEDVRLRFIKRSS